MDFGIIDVVNPLDSSLGVPSYESFKPASYAMGDTLRYAQQMKLIDMEPRGDLSSTGYALVNWQGIPHPPAERNGRSVHGDAGRRHLHGSVVQRQHPGDG
jgi:hypothetical protein